MSEEPQATRVAARDLRGAAASETQPISPASPRSSSLPGSGVAELFRRLDEHRARGARHARREPIGSGRMGEILRVRDHEFGRNLALKVLRRGSASLSEGPRTRVRARFLGVAQVTERLHHPSIVPVRLLSVDVGSRQAPSDSLRTSEPQLSVVQDVPGVDGCHTIVDAEGSREGIPRHRDSSRQPIRGACCAPPGLRAGEFTCL